MTWKPVYIFRATSYEQATRLSQLLGQILLSVHIGNFSPVNQDEIQETKLSKMVIDIRPIPVWLYQ